MASSDIGVEFTLVGDAALRRVMEELPARVQKSVGQRAFAKAAPILTNAMASEIGRQTTTRTGRLLASPGMRSKRYRSSTVTVIGPLWNKAPYANVVELGHRLARGGTLPGTRRRKANKAANPAMTGQGRQIGKVEPRPFAQTAFNQVAMQMLEVIQAEVIAGLVQQAEKST
jgi:hypothetical protein